jgi:hypothetical protein
MGMQLAKKRAGKKTDVDMSESQLEDFARKRKKRGGKMPKRGSGELTPLGSRTLAGYQERFGDSEGHSRFEEAVKAGRLERPKMFRRAANGSFQKRDG